MSVAGEGRRGPASGADFLQLTRPPEPRGLTAWLVEAVRAGIRDGQLRAGQRLPASRTLADDLQVSRGVVVEAYRRLTDEGLVSGRAGDGTRVTLPSAWPRPPGPGMAEPPGPQATAPSPAQLPQRWRSQAGFDLSPGVPDLSAFPRAAWTRAQRAVLAQADMADLGYGDPRGNERLRGELAGWLTRTRGLRAGAEDIVIVAGVAQALALLAQVLRGQGTTAVAVEDPGSRGARDQLARWGMTTAPVPVDGQGLRVDHLARSGVRAVLLTPAHQFPTGVALAPQRRRDVLDWAAGGGLIIEDDYDAEYRYDRAPVPALQAFGPDHVAYAGSTSKTLAPGMRLGWLAPPRRLRADVADAKHASDLGSPSMPQLALAHLIASGEFERHIRLVRIRQRARRDALLAAVREHLPRARVQGIAAGLHLLLTFPGLAGRADDTVLAERIRAAGVLVHPLSWHRERPGPPGLVLGYAAHAPDQLWEAVARIASAIRTPPRAF